METNQSPFLNTPQTAEYLNVSPRTLEVWRVRGEGPPFYRFGHKRGAIRYHKDDLDEYVSTTRVNLTSERTKDPISPV